METLKELANKDKIIKLIEAHLPEMIFSIGLYNTFDNVQRIYLDDLFGKNFSNSISYVTEVIQSKIGNPFYVCLAKFNESEMKCFDKETLQNIVGNGIIIPNNIIYISKYIIDDEWFGNYLIYKENPENIRKYVSGIINRILPEEVYLDVEVFFIDYNLKTIINLYDDRGLDIMNVS